MVHVPGMLPAHHLTCSTEKRTPDSHPRRFSVYSVRSVRSWRAISAVPSKRKAAEGGREGGREGG